MDDCHCYPSKTTDKWYLNKSRNLITARKIPAGITLTVVESASMVYTAATCLVLEPELGIPIGFSRAKNGR